MLPGRAPVCHVLGNYGMVTQRCSVGKRIAENEKWRNGKANEKALRSFLRGVGGGVLLSRVCLKALLTLKLVHDSGSPELG